MKGHHRLKSFSVRTIKPKKQSTSKPRRQLHQNKKLVEEGKRDCSPYSSEIKNPTDNNDLSHPQTSLSTTSKVAFDNIESAPNSAQTEPETPIKNKTQPKKQTETAHAYTKKFFTALTKPTHPN